jgi:hypothetical protein
MDRKNKGKTKLTKAMLFPQALEALVQVVEYGEEKYSDAQEKAWLSYEPVEVIDSMLRHILALTNGEIIDPESGLHHAKHIMFNAAALNEINYGCSLLDFYDG